MNQKSGTHRCPVSETLELLAKRWTLLILRQLSLNGDTRFNRLQSQLNGIGPRTLSERLKELEKEGIVTRKNYAEIPPRVEYSLSKKGEELIRGCLPPIERWARKWKANAS
jgi:DNA-binding HxlR family transcriptional regulator